MSEVKVVAVVVTYNRLELLKENINALLIQKYNNFDIMIIDNASTDGTEKYVRGIDNNKIKYINTGSNLGGAGGFSFGVRQAIEKGYDYAWLMDDDTIPSSEALDSFMNKVNKFRGEFSYLASVVRWKDGLLCEMNKQYLSQEWGNEINMMKNNLIPVNSSSFVSFFVDLNIAKKVGLPQKDFFIYGDDWEYSLRLSSVKPGYLDLDSEVVHKMKNNASIDIVNESEDRLDRYFYNYRNLYYIHRKYLSSKKLMLYKLKYYYTVVQILSSKNSKKIKRISVMRKGMKKGKKYNPAIEYV
ncbi:MAG: glycosyltransferase family 2 protein [Lachnospira sp.]|nr:glycosyltransferase family 2 protein [Lachnospira sp.]